MFFWTICTLPIAPLEVAAGFMYDFWPAMVASLIGKTGGSICSFIMSRKLQSYLKDTRWMKKFDAQLQRFVPAMQKNSYVGCTMIRLSPTPLAVKNWGLALFPPEVLSLWTYSTVTIPCNSYGTATWILIGLGASNLEEALAYTTGGGMSPTKMAAIAVGTILCIVAYVKFSGKIMAKIEASAGVVPVGQQADEKKDVQATTSSKDTSKESAETELRKRGNTRAQTPRGGAAATGECKSASEQKSD